MRKYELMINGKKFDVEIQSINNGLATVIVNGDNYQVEILGEHIERLAPQAQPLAPMAQLVAPPAPVAAPAFAPPPPLVSAPVQAAPPVPAPVATPAPSKLDLAAEAGPGDVIAPMPGLILELKVGVGDAVKTGDVVLRMEAMKMENDILATRDGVVSGVHVEKGAEVQSGQALITIGD